MNYYKNRTSTDPYGNRDLPPLQQQRVHRETAYVAKQMLIWMLSSVGSRGPVGFLMEMNAEESVVAPEEPGDASFWNLELWKAFKSIGGMRKVSFDMGVYGHKARRPTTVATNYPLLYNLEGERGLQEEYIPASLLTQGELNAWSIEFRELVRQAVSEGLDGSYVEEEELIRNGLRVSKLTKEQQAEWKQHLMNDHQPCINAQAYGYQHRRPETEDAGNVLSSCGPGWTVQAEGPGHGVR